MNHIQPIKVPPGRLFQGKPDDDVIGAIVRTRVSTIVETTAVVETID